MKTGPTIIPIAGGKGGVGKSFIAANLAIALAEAGHPTVIVDMDLGGSNLHTMLGLTNQYPGIGDFLKARSAELEELITVTPIKNLFMIAGDGLSPFMANIAYAQKMRLISRIKKLPCKYVILDLGSGTSFNTLDFFRISHNGIVVVTPEYTSIMNMLVFLKHSFLRVVERTLSKNQPVKEILHALYKKPMADQQTDIPGLLSKISAIDPEAAETVILLCNKHRPRVVFNMGRHPDECKIAQKIDHNLKECLSLEVDHFGFVFYDLAVQESIQKRNAFLPNYRETIAAINISRTSERIVKFGEDRVKDSARLLLGHTKRIWENSVSTQNLTPIFAAENARRTDSPGLIHP